MKKRLRFSMKSVLLCLIIIVTNYTVKALPYTAVNSGNWSNPATWGGVVPPTNNSSDQITIPAGKTVTMDNDCTCNGLLATLTVLGTLNSTANKTLTLSQCSLLGNGLIDVDNVIINTGAAMVYTGSIVADVLQCSALNLGLSANLTANDQLLCTQGLLSILSGGHLSLGNGADIVISGGSLELGNTTLGVSDVYNVIYNGGSCTCGDELSGLGLGNITIAVPSASTVTLTTDLVVNGVLNLTSGSLVCNGNDLSILGDVAAGGTGNIVITTASNILVSTATGLTGALNFASPNNACNNMTCNCGSGNAVNIIGALAINGALNLTSGILNFSNCDLVLNGLLTGAGSLAANTASNLTVNTSGGIATPLSFTNTGNTLHDLILNCGQGNSVPLGSPLTIEGTLGLLNGTNCILNGQTLTMGAMAVINGTGNLITNATSGLVCNCPNGLPSIHLGSTTLGNLTVNTSANNSLGLNGNLTISGLLTLTNGHLNLNGNDLTISGNIAAGGAGSISASINSDLTLNGAVPPSGSLTLTTGSVINSFTLNLGTSGNVNLGSDLNISGSLNLNNGSINTGNYGVNLAANTTINGGSASAYIITGDNGHLGINLLAGVSGMVQYPVGTISVYAPIGIQLNSGSGNGKIDVNVTGDVLKYCESGSDLSSNLPLVDLTWHTASSDVTSPNMNVVTAWPASQEVNGFNNQASYLTQYDNNQKTWDTQTPSKATPTGNGMYQMQRNSLTQLGCLAVFDNNTITATTNLADTRFNIYPNLVKDVIYIKDGNYNKEETIADVVNVNGQLIKSTKLSSEVSEILLDGLTPGNYFVKVYAGGNTEVKKFIKQ